MRRDGVQPSPANFGGESQHGRGFYATPSGDQGAIYASGYPQPRIGEFRATQDTPVEFQDQRWTSEPARTTGGSGAIADRSDPNRPPQEVVYPYATANEYLAFERAYRPQAGGSQHWDGNSWTTSSADRGRNSQGSGNSGGNSSR